MTTKSTYTELEQRIRVLEETAKGEWMQTALDASSDAIGVSTADGHHFYQNKSFDHMFGFTLEEVSRLPPRRLYGNEHVAKEVFETVMAGNSWHGEIEMVAKNGRRFPVLLRADAIKDKNGDVIGMIGVLTDITELKQVEEELRRHRERLKELVEERTTELVRADEQLRQEITERVRAEEALQESEERFRLLSEAAFEAIAIHDGGVILVANHQYFEVFGYEPDEILGVPGEQVLRLTVAPEAREAMLKQVATGGLGPYESIGLRKDGTKFPMEIRVRETEYEDRKARMVTIMDITEHKQAEAKIRESEEKYRLLFDTTEVLLSVYDREGVCQLMNSRVATLFGGEPQDFIGKSIIELHPKDGRDYLRSFNETIDSGITLEREDEVEFPLGNRWLLTRLQPLPDAQGVFRTVQIISQDITERKLAEEALVAKELELRNLAESSPGLMGTFYQRLDGSVCMPYTSPQIWRLYGLHPEDVVDDATPVLERTHPDDVKLVNESIAESARTMTPWHCEFRVNHPTRGELWLGGSTNPKPHPDGGTIWYGFVHDITERKRAEAEREKLQAQLIQAQKMEAIGTLAGGIAHDFNNILSSVIGYSELSIGKAQAGTTLNQNLQEVLNAGMRAKDLVKQILAFSRQAEQKLQPVQVRLLVKEALKLLRASLPATIEIRQNIQSEEAIFADPTQIHQIIMNLCTNAGHAMRDKGGALDVGLIKKKFDKEYAAENPEIQPGSYQILSVSDTGHGMSASEIEKIFDPFYTTKGPDEGTGMGLSAVHGIVKSHGGTIKVFSEPGKGSIFKIYFPIIESKIEPKFEVEEAISKGSEHILFVDDEKPLVDIGKRMLEKLGYRVTTRTSSIEALELFRAKPDAFDLVVTDMTMPNMTGKKLASEIMQIRPDIPIILCSGFSTKISQESAEAIGIRAFIMKPVVMLEMSTTIRKVLDQKVKKDSG